jgi:hypothetical protein
MNKDKVIYYQQHGWLTGATDFQFSLGRLQTTAWNYSPTILNQRNWLKSQMGVFNERAVVVKKTAPR